MGEIPLPIAAAAVCLSLGLAVAILAPALHGLRLLGGRLVLQLRRPAARRGPLQLSEQPLQPGLSPEHRRLAQDTRAVLLSLEHACDRAHRWSDDPAGPWWRQIFASGSDVAYAPTIGMTGDVWHWLQRAEALAERESPTRDALHQSAVAVRRVLFDERPLVERLEELVRVLVRVDDSLRLQAGSPYRDGVAPSLPPAGLDAPDTDSREHRYQRILRSHGRALRALARRFAHDPSERDDLLQEIHLAIWNALPRYRGGCSLRTYALRIARYRAITHRERHVTLAPEREWVDPAPCAEQHLDSARRHRAVGRAIQDLPSTLRAALQLRLDGFTYREIAERLGITEKNASVRVTRARQTLRRCFGGEPVT